MDQVVEVAVVSSLQNLVKNFLDFVERK